MNKELSDVLKEISSKIVTDAMSLKNVKITGGKCDAHLYHLERQGDSEKSRYIYRCQRPGCRHYATFTNVEFRKAMCRDCNKPFIIGKDHVIKNYNGNTIEEIFYEFPSCGCTKVNKEVKQVVIDEVDNLDGDIE